MPTTTVYLAADSQEDRHHQISPTLLALFRAVAAPGHYAIDVGCGSGRLTFEIAPHLAHTIGIDLDMDAIDKAQTATDERGLESVSFFVADAEQVDYSEFITFEPYDLVTAHLCMSTGIIERAAAALRPGGRFLFAALESDQWIETGHPSSFAMSRDGMAAALNAAGLSIEYLGVESDVLEYDAPETLAASWLNGSAPKWLNADRRGGLEKHVKDGGTTLTVKSHLIGRACKMG